MIIDTHSHLNFKAYEKDLDEVIKRTRENNISCINVGTKFETSKVAVGMAEQNEDMFAAIGLHPIHIKTDVIKIRMDEDEGGFTPAGELFLKDNYKELAKSKKVVAIGEIGLDYYYKPKTKERLEIFKKKQKEIFTQQLDFAKELNLPVIIHCRVAHKDAIEILKSYPELLGVIHCFTGSIEEMKQYLELGFYIGINGIIFKLPLDEVVKKCPLDKILLETDCPYLTPLPAATETKAGPGRFIRNEPAFIKHTINKISELKDISFEEICQKTTENAKNLFKI